MAQSRAPMFLGLAGLGGLGYYFYNAGGSPKVAKNRFESDIHHAAAEAKEHLPHRSATDAERYGTNVGREAGAKFDNAVSTADKELSKAKSETESYVKATKADTMQKIDEIDRKVEDKAASTKSYISSWFGGK